MCKRDQTAPKALMNVTQKQRVACEMRCICHQEGALWCFSAKNTRAERI